MTNDQAARDAAARTAQSEAIEGNYQGSRDVAGAVSNAGQQAFTNQGQVASTVAGAVGAQSDAGSHDDEIEALKLALGGYGSQRAVNAAGGV